MFVAGDPSWTCWGADHPAKLKGKGKGKVGKGNIPLNTNFSLHDWQGIKRMKMLPRPTT